MSENKSQKKRIWFITILILLVLLLISLFVSGRRGKIVYREYLSEDILTVDGEKLQLGDLAMYIAYEELKVEDEAAAYDYYDTNKYWNLHTSGRFVKEVAKTHVIEMAVHDEIFYRQAMAEKLTLDEKEEEQLRSRQEDFWTDMTEEQQERLGVDKAEIDRQLEKAALAQKYQNQIAAENNSDFDGYSAGAEPYEHIFKEHKYKLNEKLWDRVDFGNIILNH